MKNIFVWDLRGSVGVIPHRKKSVFIGILRRCGTVGLFSEIHYIIRESVYIIDTYILRIYRVYMLSLKSHSPT